MDKKTCGFCKKHCGNDHCVTNNQTPNINEFMENAEEKYKYYWCDSKVCGCMGCINKAGGADEYFSKEEWQDWVDKNPKDLFCNRNVKVIK